MRLFVLAVALLLASPLAADAAKPDRSFFGVAPQSGLGEQDFELMKEDGVGSIRQLVLWAAIEPSPGEYQWGPVDDVVREAAEAGITVLPVLYGTPAWAQSERLEKKCGVTCGPSSDFARKAFADFAKAAVARYKPGGVFWTDPPGPDPPPPPPPPPGPPPNPCPLPIPLPCKAASDGAGVEPGSRRAAPCQCTDPLPIRSWQVWNEQNSSKYYGPKPDIGGYSKLLRLSAAAIRSEDSSAEVVLGGMWGPPDVDVVIPTHTYLERLYRIRKIEAAFDSIALHPYAARFDSTVEGVASIRELADKAGDRDAALVITELGWASGGPKSEGLVKTPREQAKLLRDSYALLLDKRRAWNITSVYWYSWRDTDTSANICAWCPKSGLRTLSGKAKPAAKAFRKLSFARSR